jgi:hypothetical protein
MDRLISVHYALVRVPNALVRVPNALIRVPNALIRVPNALVRDPALVCVPMPWFVSQCPGLCPHKPRSHSKLLSQIF